MKSYPNVLLSICIGTYNRANFIGETLDSIMNQLTDQCEVVISDNASTDATAEVVSKYTERCNKIRYFKQEYNIGFDRNFDAAVRLADGTYCWLMSDDDIVRPGAVQEVLRGIRLKVSVVIITTEIRDFGLEKVLQHRWPNFSSDRLYRPDELDLLFVEVGGALNVNAYVIRKDIWISRETMKYYGSLMIQVGVVFQSRLPGDVLVIAKPLIVYRRGNLVDYAPVFAELRWKGYPSLAESLAISEETRAAIKTVEPWKHWQELLLLRARGYYSRTEYRKWVRPRLRSKKEILVASVVMMFPGQLLNLLVVVFCTVFKIKYQNLWESGILLHMMAESPFYYRNVVSRHFNGRRDGGGQTVDDRS